MDGNMNKFHAAYKSYWSPFLAAVLIMSALVYVWSSHYNLTLEERAREEMTRTAFLQDEQKKLKEALVKKKSPDRIAAIAREKLQMTYPKREQIILIKKP